MEELIHHSSDLTLLRQRDAAAFTKLVHDHEHVVVGLARAMGLSGADLEDAAAEAFAEVYRSLPRFQGRAAISTWVYQIASRAVWRVRESRQKRAHAALIDDVEDTAHPSPADEVEALQEKQRIWDAVAKLDHRQATAVELFYGRDCTIEEVAQVLVCPVGTVKTLLFRARAALRDKLKQEEH